MIQKEPETFCPASQQEWRQWLTDNHQEKQSVWLIYYKTSSQQPSLSWSDAVDEALCFGWIDSTRKSIDSEKFLQLFSKRKPKSTWSKINKEKVSRLIQEGHMNTAGLKCIEIAKQNGSWNILDEVEELKMPKDLELALASAPESIEFFHSLSKSVKKSILHWIVVAKKPETRNKRITEIALFISQKQKPRIFF